MKPNQPRINADCADLKRRLLLIFPIVLIFTLVFSGCVMFSVSTRLIADAPARRSTKPHEVPLNIRVGSCDFVDRLL